MEQTAQECPEFSYVEQIRWKYQGNTYGIIDFKMKCHGELFWRQPAIGNPDGAWDPIMDCSVCRKIKQNFKTY